MAGNGKDTSGSAAFVIRIAGQAGPRAIDVTFGVPLDMTVNDIHHYVDKVCLVIDRQTYKGELMKTKADLDGAKKALDTHLEQHAAMQAKSLVEWESSGRKGDWRPTSSQAQQINNFETTIRELRDKRIPNYQKDIEFLEGKIALEG